MYLAVAARVAPVNLQTGHPSTKVLNPHPCLIPVMKPLTSFTALPTRSVHQTSRLSFEPLPMPSIPGHVARLYHTVPWAGSISLADQPHANITYGYVNPNSTIRT
ncbi:hypothetical protein LZ30DRAFT_712625 [Colletotrichum cereale]|nr:hypothetical protein LZ30DRAFT_712625 [Colletotrichum cereale]